ncbi:MAG: hypothetical protein FIA91_12840 [Geobacter sp.]|nr:hypothetical protein [Geobacter sp.]
MISLFSKILPPLPYPGKNYHKLLYPLFWGTLALLLYFHVTRPICDPDFWWHLKSGDLMVRQKGLLKADPFNYTGDGMVRGFQAVLLYGYWLWETGVAAIYNSLGFKGIFLVKSLTAALLAGVVYFEMMQQKLSQFTMTVLTGLGALLFVNLYHLERPQVFSFILMTMLVGTISRLRQGAAPNFILFPLMILWANIHRGFVIGDILLALCTAGFMIQYRHDGITRRRLITWALGGILVSFINPNGWSTLTELVNFMQNSISPDNVDEYRSTWQLFTLQSKIAAISLWTLAGLHLAGLLLAPRRFWPEILISLFIIAFGLAYIRNAGFIAISLLPMTGWYVEQASARLRIKPAGYVQAATCALFVLLISWLALGEWSRHKGAHGPVNAVFPANMAQFLKTSGLSGNLFNDYNAGGYLNWALYPEWKTFIDGRELDTQVSHQYLKMIAGSTEYLEGKPYYEQLLDQYRIDVVALEIACPDGRLQPLLKLLLNSREWVPVFLDNQAFVLARFTPQNAATIRNYGLDKDRFVAILTGLAADSAVSPQSSVRNLILYADILSYGGRQKDAAAVIQRVDTSNLPPDINAYLRNCLKS